MDLLIVILLVLFGAFMLAIECFLVPGFGLAGVFGVVSSIGGVWYAYEKLTPYYPHAGLITLLVTIILFIVIFVLFLRGKTLKKMELETTIDSSVDLAKPGKRMDELTEQNNKN